MPPHGGWLREVLSYRRVGGRRGERRPLRVGPWRVVIAEQRVEAEIVGVGLGEGAPRAALVLVHRRHVPLSPLLIVIALVLLFARPRVVRSELAS